VGEGYLMMPGSCLHAARPSVMSSAADTRTDLRSMSLDLRVGGRFDTALEFCVPGNGLNGIRFTLAGRRRISLTSCFASTGVSLMPFINVYSKVIVARGLRAA